MAVDHVLNASADSVLRRHLFPTYTALQSAGVCRLAASRRCRPITERGDAILEQTRPLLDALAQRNGVDTAADLNVSMIENGVAHLKASFDTRHGGLGSAPKFPNEPDWALFLRLARNDSDARTMVIKTLASMAAGGIYDHLAGGFCRYSVDERWEIPHFEKMLYDKRPIIKPVCRWLVADRRGALARDRGGKHPLAARRIARYRGGFLCCPGCRLRGSRRQILCLGT